MHKEINTTVSLQTVLSSPREPVVKERSLEPAAKQDHSDVTEASPATERFALYPKCNRESLTIFP